MWRVSLPDESTPTLERWAEDVGVVLLEAAWEVSILSVPHAFSPIDRVPAFGTREALIARLVSPESHAQTSLSLDTGGARQAISMDASDSRIVFVVFTVPWPGSNEIEVGADRNALRFDTEIRSGITGLREALNHVPVLRLTIGENRIEAWKEPFELRALLMGEEPPEIVILPVLDGMRLGLSWKDSDGGGGNRENLTRKSATKLLRDWWGKDVEVRIGGGALGSVRLRFRPPEKERSDRSINRALRWASLAVSDEGRSRGAWMLRRAADLDSNMLRAAQRGGISRWAPLAIRAVKESKN